MYIYCKSNYSILLKQKSTVHTIMLDASKAFDRVYYVKLFKLLFKREVCHVVLRFLIELYTNQN